MAKHKVRDVAASRADREVAGSGIYGVASGGLSGDGDVQMFTTLASVQRKVSDYFAECLGSAGTLVRLRYVTVEEGLDLMASVDAQFAGWSCMVNGACRDIVVDVEGLAPLRVGVFRCFQGWEDPPGVKWPTAWWIPYEVRLPAGISRKVFDDGRMGH